ncbi:MAG TPA: ABC transporter permease [Anaeromyxobacteraceae bacterium]|nr:ABC transporter permease [Anaeromyxobacteraceae bacterium]
MAGPRLRPRTTEIQFGERLTPLGNLVRSVLTSGPAIGWVTIFLLLPLLGILLFSVLTRGPYGEVALPFTVGNYLRLAGFGLFGFDPQYPVIILRSLLLAAGTTLVCVLAAFPLAFFIAGLPGRAKQIALTLVVIPFWTNLLIRTYAWQILFAPDAAITRAAAAVGLAEEGMPLYPSTLAVTVGMLAAYLPFLVLPLYTSVEKIDWTIAEAASDLGADGPRVFRHAILPQVMPGMVAGMILVFIPATGQFVIPDLLGGAKTVMLGNAIQQQFGASRDWPFGSAIALVAMGVVLVGLWLQTRYASQGEGGPL